ncbi:hypothetical protein BH10ACT8_BH10ACT8_11190 [soil metagenome]
MQAFSASQGTAADRASLLGATLKAANGDALSYSAAIASTTVASHALVTSFQDQAANIADLRAQISSGKLDAEHLADAQVKLTRALGSSELAAINLKTGVIDLAKDGAAPLVTQLQAIQDGATAAASATYLHEKATKGATLAADDAFKVYESQTKGALISQATQLGLTSAQAGKLADQYFGIKNSGDLKKKIEEVGGNSVISVLQSIKDLLEIVAGIKPRPDIALVGAARAASQADAIQSKLSALNGFHAISSIDTYYNTYVGNRPTQDPKTGNYSTPVKKQATGGTIHGPGSGTSDTAGIFALSNGEEVTPAAQATKYRALLKAIAADKVTGMAAGGTVGHYRTHAAKITPTTITDADAGGAVYGVASYLRSQLPDVRAAAANLSRAVDDAFQLRGVTAKLAQVRANLASMRAASAQLSTGVTSTLSGTVDPTKYTSIGDLAGAYYTGTSNNTHFIASERAAAAKGVNRDLLAQLVASGNSAGLDSAASGSRNEVNNLNKAFAEYRTTSAIGGQVAGSSVYGSRIAADNQRVATLEREARATNANVDHLVAAIGKLTNRPVEIKVDGKTIARAVIGSGEFQGVMDNLGHLITEKRR